MTVSRNPLVKLIVRLRMFYADIRGNIMVKNGTMNQVNIIWAWANIENNRKNLWQELNNMVHVLHKTKGYYNGEEVKPVRYYSVAEGVKGRMCGADINGDIIRDAQGRPKPFKSI